MIERALILVVIIGVALAVVELRERRLLPAARVMPGITVVTGPGCRLCPPLLAALDASPATYRLVDVARTPPPEGVRAMPTVLVADEWGKVFLRRSGRSAVTDVETIVAAAAERSPETTP